MLLNLTPIEGDPGAEATSLLIEGGSFLPCVSGDVRAGAVMVAVPWSDPVPAIAVEIPVETSEGPKAARVLFSVDGSRVLTASMGHVERWIRSHV